MDQYVGRYRLAGKLGKGAMGVVYLAEDPLLNRQVALKTVDFSAAEDDQRGFLHERLIRDARAAAALNHPHIVSVFDVVEQGETAWLVMEYITGETLAQRLTTGPPLDTGFALRILGEVAAALDYTHARGVIHRDIKPSNIMIDTHGAAKIMDFGIARLSDGRTTTPTGMVMGTLEYMAPEQIKGEPLDGRADQFALAAVAYQMFTGSTLFGPQTMTALTYKLVNETQPLPRVRNPGLPHGVDDVLSRALSKQPAERFVNCAGFVAALTAAFAGDVPAAAPTGITPAESGGNKKWLWAGLAAALVIAGLAVGGIVLKHRQNLASQPVAAVSKPTVAQPPATSAPVPTATTSSAAATSSAAPTSGAAPAATPPSKGAVTPPTPAPVTPPGGASASASAPPKAPSKTSPPAASPPAETKPAPIHPPPAPVASAPPGDPKPAGGAVAGASVDEARALIEKRDFAPAVSLLTRVIAANPLSGQAYELRGLANQQLNLFENAIEDYTKDLRINPTHASALHSRGICHVQLHQDNLALADFNSAQALQPNFAPTYVARGEIFFRRHAYKKAIADFSDAIRLSPNNANAYLGRSKARRESGDPAGAEEDAKIGSRLKSR
jgi:eukaryotic-like serine/threonine-protein kinase